MHEIGFSLGLHWDSNSRLAYSRIMQTNRSQNGLGAAPASVRDAAFVVHLAEAASGPRGRVEHVVTGRVGRFESADELVGFMRQTLAAIAGQGEQGEGR